MCSATGLRPDPLGSLQRSPESLARLGRNKEGQKGKERREGKEKNGKDSG